MNRYTPEIKKEKKTPPKIRGFLIVLTWIVWSVIFAVDIYGFAVLNLGITASDVFCDFGLLVIAVYFTRLYVKGKKDVKKQ